MNPAKFFENIHRVMLDHPSKELACWVPPDTSEAGNLPAPIGAREGGLALADGRSKSSRPQPSTMGAATGTPTAGAADEPPADN